MDTATAPSAPITLVVYNRRAVYLMLRDWTPLRLRGELTGGTFGASLAPAEIAELAEHLTAWVQRALGALSLRDALQIDPERGRRVFSLLCAAQTSARAAAPPEGLPLAPAELAGLPAALATSPELAALARMAVDEGMALAALSPAGDYPFPTDLTSLAPILPPPYRAPQPPFEQPSGWRRRIAALLATAGVALLAIPMLLGQIPEHPAGWPLALLTLALLVGIKAGPAGFLGSLCIWLVANLPGFRHGSPALTLLWPAIPLMALGLTLLGLDRRVRGMWLWLKRQIVGDTTR